MVLSDKLHNTKTLKKFKNSRGVTLIEIIVVTSIFITLVAFTTISILNVRSKTSASVSLTTFTTDLKNQQVKAMSGDTEGGSAPDSYGIHISQGNYTLFRGDAYSANNSTNFNIEVPNGYTMSTSFPSSEIIFASQSGEISNYVDGQNSVILTETSSGSQKTIQLNPYGVVISSN